MFARIRFCGGPLMKWISCVRYAPPPLSRYRLLYVNHFFSSILIFLFGVDLCKSIRWCVIFHRRGENEKRINASLKVHRSIFFRRSTLTCFTKTTQRRRRQSMTPTMIIIKPKQKRRRWIKSCIYFRCGKKYTRYARVSFSCSVVGVGLQSVLRLMLFYPRKFRSNENYFLFFPPFNRKSSHFHVRTNYNVDSAISTWLDAGEFIKLKRKKRAKRNWADVHYFSIKKWF